MADFYKTNRATSETGKRIHAAGLTVRAWAESWGFNVQTVRNLMAGNYGDRRTGMCGLIREALIADGFIDQE